MLFDVAGAGDFVDRQKRTKRGNFAHILNTVAGVGHLKTMWKDEFRGAGTVQETCSSEMLGGLGTDFWRGVGLYRASNPQGC